jgi:hypothetical protein
VSEFHTLMTGLVVGESPRWHAGRLWFLVPDEARFVSAPSPPRVAPD